MAEPFKNFINATLVRSASRHLADAWPDFPSARFVSLACKGLESLELKARAMQVTAALEATLPADFADAADVLERALASPPDDTRMAGLDIARDGLRGWILWSAGEFVVRRGMDAPERALAALHAITQRFTAEFAIRPFIVAHPALVFSTLARWTRDPSEHVRRLVSEGTRPRLPWGIRLHSLVADPSPSLSLLRALQDDESEYVRRSVANHLNDIAKDHPDLVADWLEEHLPNASTERRALLRHATRTLIKQGNRRVLAVWGVGSRLAGSATLSVAPRRVAIGESVTITVALQSESARAQTLLIDYTMHHVKSDGSTSPKVFKGWKVELAPHSAQTLTRRHSLRVVTTRRYYPGTHTIDLHVNGGKVASASFRLTK